MRLGLGGSSHAAAARLCIPCCCDTYADGVTACAPPVAGQRLISGQEKAEVGPGAV